MLMVAVSPTIGVGVNVGVGVVVGVEVGVGVGDEVAVGVGVTVGLLVGVGELVGSRVPSGVDVGDGVAVGAVCDSESASVLLVMLCVAVIVSLSSASGPGNAPEEDSPVEDVLDSVGEGPAVDPASLTLFESSLPPGVAVTTTISGAAASCPSGTPARKKPNASSSKAKA